MFDAATHAPAHDAPTALTVAAADSTTSDGEVRKVDLSAKKITIKQ